MPFYRSFSFFVLVIIMSLSTFYFLQNQDDLAKLLIFAAVYIYIGLFYIFKSLYYLRYKATFNEIFFVVGLPLLPPLFAGLGEITGLNQLYPAIQSSNLLVVHLNLSTTTEATILTLSLASILCLPYFFFSIYLLLRSLIRYEFLRWRAHSTKGPSATFIALILALGIGIIYLVVSLILSDVLLAIFGFVYALNGILGFLA